MPERHYYGVGSHLTLQTVQNETFQSFKELSDTYPSGFDITTISSITWGDFLDFLWYFSLQVLFLAVLQTSADDLCKNSGKANSLPGLCHV